MARKRRFWFKTASLTAVPLVLALVVRQQLSWRPRTFTQGRWLTCLVFSPLTHEIAIGTSPANPSEVIYPADSPLLSSRTPLIQFFNPVSHKSRFIRQRARAITRIRYSADGTLLATATERDPTNVWPASWGDTRIRVWDAKTGNLVRVLPHEGMVECFAVSAQNDILVSRYAGKMVAIWHMKTGQLVRTVPVAKSKDDGMFRAVACQSSYLATVSYQTSAIKIWSLQSGALVRQIALPLFNSNESDPLQWVNALAFSPDGKLLASSSGYEVRLYSSANGTLLHTFALSRSQHPALSFSPDGKLLAAAGTQTLVCDIAKEQVLRTLPVSSWDVAFSPDGTDLAVIDAPRGSTSSFANTCALHLWRVR